MLLVVPLGTLINALVGIENLNPRSLVSYPELPEYSVVPSQKTVHNLQLEPVELLDVTEPLKNHLPGVNVTPANPLAVPNTKSVLRVPP